MQFTDEETATLTGAIAAWGEESQIYMAIGEIGELLTLVGRRAQNRDTAEDWHTEIADVMVTVEQLAHIMGYAEVARLKQLKMERLNSKVTKALTGQPYR